MPSYFLESTAHYNHFTTLEYCCSCPPLSGAFYAEQHWRAANEDSAHALGHRVIAIIEYIPVLGAIAALIERIFFWISETCFSPATIPETDDKEIASASVIIDNKASWRKKPIDLETAIVKMVKNAHKAVHEHGNEEYVSKKIAACYKGVDASIPTAEGIAKMVESEQPGLKFTHAIATECGGRPYMEDRSFYQEKGDFIIAGVFDGHAGDQVAAHVSTQLPGLLFAQLKQEKQNVHHALEVSIDTVQKQVVAHPEWDQAGSTAVITVIDKRTNLIYTATLADSEANVYRKDDKEMMSIPLSCIRDWRSEKDAQRAADALGEPDIAKEWPAETDRSKKKRYTTINVSRAIGDVNIGEAMSHKPKITINQLKAGDTLILASDGLKDNVEEPEIISNVALQSSFTANTIAETLVAKAVERGGWQVDNITVIAIKVGTD